MDINAVIADLHSITTIKQEQQFTLMEFLSRNEPCIDLKTDLCGCASKHIYEPYFLGFMVTASFNKLKL